jgi:hypothetical protein
MVAANIKPTTDQDFMFVFSGRAGRDHPLPTMTLPLLALLYQIESAIRQIAAVKIRISVYRPLCPVSQTAEDRGDDESCFPSTGFQRAIL